MASLALTTVDNPYDPFDEFVQWFDWDESHGYHTSGLIADLSHTSGEFGEKLNDSIVKESFDRIIEIFGPGTYRIVTRGEA